MFHHATQVQYHKPFIIEVTFQDGYVKTYDISLLFEKYPQLKKLEDYDFFQSGKLVGGYGIIWDDELDLEVETIYESGTVLRKNCISTALQIGISLAKARSGCGFTQQKLADLSGIDQSDISKIERGTANPSIKTLERLANVLSCELEVSFTKF